MRKSSSGKQVGKQRKDVAEVVEMSNGTNDKMIVPE